MFQSIAHRHSRSLAMTLVVFFFWNHFYFTIQVRKTDTKVILNFADWVTRCKDRNAPQVPLITSLSKFRGPPDI